MTHIEAMKQALAKVRAAQQCHPNAVMTLLCEADELLEQAIATEESSATQEPVAWVLEWSFNGEEIGRRIYDDETHCKFDAGNDGGVCRPLIYGDTRPQPKREPLTVKDIKRIATYCGEHITDEDVIEITRRVEAAHGIGAKE